MVQKINLNALLGTMIMITPLCIKLPQMIDYVRKFEGNATMSLRLVTANC